MTKKAFNILCAITAAFVILAAVAIFSQPTFETSYPQGESLLPNLVRDADKLKSVVIRQKGETLSLDRDGGVWRARERHNFEADSRKVANLLIALARMTKVEGKTKEPARYERLEVEDPSGKTSHSRQVTLIDASGKEIGSIVLGKRQYNMGTQGNNTYVRIAGDPQVWLASGEVEDSETGVVDWLKKDVVDVPAAQIARVTVTLPNGEKVVAKRETPQSPNMIIENLPKSAAAASDGTADGYARILSSVTLEDIAPAADKVFPKDQTYSAVIEGLVGFRVNIEMAEIDGVNWVKLKATPPPPEPATPGAGKIVDMRTDWTKVMTDLNARFDGWALALPLYQVAPLKNHMTDLLKKAPE